ncbi:Small-conductance mechanosensitive channel [Poseidonocella sedimentorum]|uniref:Small-conductance mechanosensitive channel n=2 Tax=Poseidonocella sedimentorum TaxID=871652 RepID=A0A1I6CV17_9RHOB|nr:Small-conductance mechanosensitive channel [Poseidonocella sedimentorum]
MCETRAAARVVVACLAALLAVLCLALPSAAQDGSDYWYETEPEGIGTRIGDALDRSTPRQTMRGFTNASDARDYERAARYLNLSRLSPADRATRGPEIARQLASIMERQVWIDWTGLPARPDARIERSGDSNGRAGQPRRDLHVKTLDAGGSAYDIRLARYKPPEAPALWLFTPQTVENVGPLYATYGPRKYESMIPERLKREVWGLWLWEWIVVPLSGLGALLLGWGTYALVSALSRRSERGWLKAGLERSALPLAILVMASAGQMLLSWVVSFSGPVHAFLRPTLTILMVWGVGMTFLRMLDAILHRITLRYVGEIDDRRGRDEREFYTSIYALRRLIVLVMVAVAAMVVLAQLNLFESLGLTLLASAGVLTVVFGIAGQAVLGNIIASLQIAFAKPVRIGDAILFEGDWAYVEAIFYTFLRLRTWDKRRIVVPVTYFVSKPFENWSVTEARMMRVIELWLDPRCEVDVLRRKFEALLKEDPDIEDPENTYTYATEHRPEGLKVGFYAMMPDPSTGWAVQGRLRERLLAHVRDEHPDWLPRERIMDVGAAAGGAARAGAAD